MSYPVAPADSTPRPPVVSAASALLFVLAGLEVISVVLSITTLGPTRRVYEDLFADVPNSDTTVTFGTISVYVAIVFALLLAAAYLVLGIFTGRGKNPARIVTWVIGGIVVLCTGCGLAATASMDSLLSGIDTGTTGGPTPGEVQDAISAALPGWYGPVSLAVSVITIILLLTVIVLLALPASNAYFRKPEPVWTPPTWTGDPAAQPPAAPPAGGSMPPTAAPPSVPPSAPPQQPPAVPPTGAPPPGP
jgi:hypothetical protein